MTLGQRIQALRKGMSREKFAPLTEISKNTLVNYEKDERVPGADYLLKLLRQFPDINPTWLLTGEGDMRRGNTQETSGCQEKVHEPQAAARLLQAPYYHVLDSAEMDADLIWKVLDAIHSAAREVGVELSYEKRLAIQNLVYADAIHKDRKPSKEFVDILVRLTV